MAANSLKRKLAAILAADAVGYSKLMSADEEGTMKVLAAHRAVIDARGVVKLYDSAGSPFARKIQVMLRRPEYPRDAAQ